MLIAYTLIKTIFRMLCVRLYFTSPFVARKLMDNVNGHVFKFEEFRLNGLCYRTHVHLIINCYCIRSRLNIIRSPMIDIYFLSSLKSGILNNVLLTC